MKRSTEELRSQHWLPFVPSELEALGLKGVDARPRCSKGRPAGFLDVRRRPGRVAWKDYPHVQHTGTNVYTGVYLDVDRPVADLLAKVDDGTLPAPSVTVTRSRSGHSQCGWILSDPVHRYPTAAPKPVGLFVRTAEYYAQVLEADPGYTSMLFRNGPLHEIRSGWHVEYNGPPGGWSLYELSDWVPYGWRRPRRPLTAEGRNTSVFLSLCRFAGSARGRTADLAVEAARLNGKFQAPLPGREIHHVVKHVERYRAGWEANGWHRPSWIARQAARGRKGGLKGGPASGAARRARIRERDCAIAGAVASGLSYRDVAERFGVAVDTVFRALARVDCGKVSDESQHQINRPPV